MSMLQHPNYSFEPASNPFARRSQGGQGGGFMSHFMNAMAGAKQMEHERFMALAGHVMSEEAKQSEHSRNLEFHGTVAKNAAPGTELKYAKGDLNVSYTTKPAKARAPKPAASSGTFSPVATHEEPQMEAPAAAESSAPKPMVTRDPKTGRAMSLKGAKPTVAKAPKSSTAGKPTVTRNPKTGRIQSLKTK